MKIFAISLGCPKNGIDTEISIASIKKAFNEIELINKPDTADIILINTCGFLRSAVSEAIDCILQIAHQKKSHQKLVVIGCMVERYPITQLKKELPEVDLFVGTNHYEIIGKKIRENLYPSTTQEDDLKYQDNECNQIVRYFNLTTPPWRSYVKIAEGCSNRCTYCIIPRLRGKLNCIPPHHILREIKCLQEKGVKEITLVAQDLTAYNFEGMDLLGLLKLISDSCSIPWIRLLYLNPAKVTMDIIKFIESSKNIVPYFDIPIQHASDNILKRMGRRYTNQYLRGLFNNIRDICPSAALRTTIMTGFPGETQEDHEIMMDFIEEIKFDHLGVFVYSDEEEAASYNFKEKVPKKFAIVRKNELTRLQKSISKKRLKKWIGKEADVLVEGISPESDLLYFGRLKQQAPDIDGVVYLSGDGIKIGDFVKVKITDSHIYDLAGEVIGESST